MLAASQRHHEDNPHKAHHHHHHHHHHASMLHHHPHHPGGHHHGHHHHQVGGAMSMSPAPDSSQDGVHDLDDEKLDVVGTSDGRDGASPLHISDGKERTLLSLSLCVTRLFIVSKRAKK